MLRRFMRAAMALAAFVQACTGFGSGVAEDRTDAGPDPVATDAATPDASLSADAGADAPRGCVDRAKDDASFCWDFTADDIREGVFVNQTGEAQLYRDTSSFISAPASLYSSIAPSASQSAARLGVSLGPLDAGTVRVGASVFVDRCEGSSNGLPSYLELFCTQDLDQGISAVPVVVLRYAGNNLMDIHTKHRLTKDSGVLEEVSAPFAFPDRVWARLEIEATFGNPGRVVVTRDGAEVARLDAVPIVCAGAPEILFMFGAQHRFVGASPNARCTARFDDVTLEQRP